MKSLSSFYPSQPILFFWILILFSLFNFSNSFAQDCPTEYITISTQGEIDNFAMNYPNCTELPEGMLISGEFIYNLDGISHLSYIEILRIQENPNLIDISGLENLEQCQLLHFSENHNLSEVNGFDNLTQLDILSIKHNYNLVEIIGFNSIANLGHISISANKRMKSLSGFSALKNIAEDFFLSQNDSLQHFSGFAQLDSIQGDILFLSNDQLLTLPTFEELEYVDWIVFNGGVPEFDYFNSVVTTQGIDFSFSDGIVNFSGFNSLETIYDRLEIDVAFNNSWKTIGGFNQLDSIYGKLNVDGVRNLVSWDGFENLEYIGNGFTVYGLDSLQKLPDFNNLKTIVGKLEIASNELLSDISGIGNIDYSQITDLEIRNNEFLSLCNEFSICNYLASGGTAEILNNNEGCNFSAEVLGACDFSFGIVTVDVFYDGNQNGVHDGNEISLDNISLSISPLDQIFYSNSLGENIFLPNGAWNISLTENVLDVWSVTIGTGAHDIVLDEGNNYQQLSFALYPVEQIPNMQSIVNSGNARCNEWLEVDIAALNIGVTFNTGTLWLEIDENISEINYDNVPDITNGNWVGWSFENLAPSQSISESIDLKIPGPPDFPVGNELVFNSYVEFTYDGGELETEGYTYPVLVLCSYDPNDKMVFPQRDDNYTLFDERLIYTIRFQNTGNAEAYNVTILDTLDDNLSAASFQLLSSSHLGQLQTSITTDKYISFDFTDINLPDSTTDLAGSQGYVSYSIDALPGLAEETSIYNSASIYFDQNPPIHTNTTENIMVSQLPTAIKMLLEPDQFSIFPNPGNGLFKIDYRENEKAKYTILDNRGHVIFSGWISGNREIDLTGQAAGLYLIKLTKASGSATRRFVKLE